jgi:hypothetical protein
MLALLVIGATFQEPVRAWGFDGHAQIGNLALQEADAGAASRVWHLLGSNDTEALAEACNWPDRVQKTPRWKWGEPQHFVNIPHTASRYARDRDCPDDLCVTEAIKKYAGQLADSRRDGRSRWRAFAWLCHLTGDLHQPLHAGYLDDRGGNSVEIIYRGEEANLHQFWDRVLIQERLPHHSDWQNHIPGLTAHSAANAWNPSEVNDWTSESHELVKLTSYPPDQVIPADFADQSWLLIRQQWLTAGLRLARILNATLGEGEVVIETAEPAQDSADD